MTQRSKRRFLGQMGATVIAAPALVATSSLEVFAKSTTKWRMQALWGGARLQ